MLSYQYRYSHYKKIRRSDDCFNGNIETRLWSRQVQFSQLDDFKYQTTCQLRFSPLFQRKFSLFQDRSRRLEGKLNVNFVFYSIFFCLCELTELEKFTNKCHTMIILIVHWATLFWPYYVIRQRFDLITPTLRSKGKCWIDDDARGACLEDQEPLEGINHDILFKLVCENVVLWILWMCRSRVRVYLSRAPFSVKFDHWSCYLCTQRQNELNLYYSIMKYWHTIWLFSRIL